MAFYFRFVLPNKQRIEMGLGEQVLKQVLLQLDDSFTKQLNNSIDNCNKFEDAIIVNVLCNRMAGNNLDDFILVSPADVLKALKRSKK